MAFSLPPSFMLMLRQQYCLAVSEKISRSDYEITTTSCTSLSTRKRNSWALLFAHSSDDLAVGAFGQGDARIALPRRRGADDCFEMSEPQTIHFRLSGNCVKVYGGHT